MTPPRGGCHWCSCRAATALAQQRSCKIKSNCISSAFFVRTFASTSCFAANAAGFPAQNDEKDRITRPPRPRTQPYLARPFVALPASGTAATTVLPPDELARELLRTGTSTSHASSSSLRHRVPLSIPESCVVTSSSASSTGTQQGLDRENAAKLRLFSRPVTAHPVLVKATIEKLQQEEEARRPMVSFIGESNVGKSSLLNALLNHRKLAVSSRTAGQTRHLFRFDVGGTPGPGGTPPVQIKSRSSSSSSFTFIDLPGYGFAKVERQLRQKWKEMLDAFCAQRITRRLLKCCICLVDARKGIQTEDEQIWRKAFAGYAKLIVLTKIDLLTPDELHHAAREAGRRIVEMNQPLPFDELLYDEHQSAQAKLYGRVGGRGLLGEEGRRRLQFGGGRGLAGRLESANHASRLNTHSDSSDSDSSSTFMEEELAGGPANIIPGLHCVSSAEKLGIRELQAHILMLCGLWKMPHEIRSSTSYEKAFAFRNSNTGAVCYVGFTLLLVRL